MLWVFLRLHLVLGVLLLPISLGAGEGDGDRKRAPTDPCVRESLEELTGAVDKLADNQSIDKDVAKMDIVFDRALTQRDVTAAAKAVQIPTPGRRPSVGTDKSHYADAIGKKDVVNLGRTETRKRADTEVRGTPNYREPVIKMPAVIHARPGIDRKAQAVKRRERVRMPALKESVVVTPTRELQAAPAPATAIAVARTQSDLKQALDLDLETDSLIADIFQDSNARTTKRNLGDILEGLNPQKRKTPISGAERKLKARRIDQMIREIETAPEVANRNKRFLQKAKAIRDILISTQESAINGVPVSHIPIPMDYWRSDATPQSHPHLYKFVRPKSGEKPQYNNSSDNIPGSPGDAHFYGTGFGGRIYPREVLSALGPNGKPMFEIIPFKDGQVSLPKDFEVNRVLIAKAAPGSSKENVTDPVLRTLLMPGEFATLLIVAGERNVYITHPMIPSSVPYTMDAHLAWAKDHAYRVIKIGRPPADELEFNDTLIRMRREILVRHLEKEFNDHTATDGGRIWKDPLPLDEDLFYRNAVTEDMLEHRISEEVAHDIVRYFSSICDAPCKRNLEIKFAAEKLQTPARVALAHAIEQQLSRTIYEGGYDILVANDLLRMGNWSRVTLYHSGAKALMDEFRRGVTVTRLNEINELLLEQGFPPARDLAKEIATIKHAYPKWAAAFDDPDFKMPYDAITPNNLIFIVHDINGGKNIANGLPFDR